jgi:hypothetical protein
MRPTHEFTLELTAQELLDPPDLKSMFQPQGANLAQLSSEISPAPSLPANDEGGELEIELTSEEIDDLLEGRFRS